MLIKASFQKLSCSVNGLYRVYDLSPDEEASFISRFNKFTSLGTTYLTYDSLNRFIFLELFVHNYWIPKKFDICNDITNFFGREFSRDEIEKISDLLEREHLILNVDYDFSRNIWALDEHSKLELFEKINEKILLEDSLA